MKNLEQLIADVEANEGLRTKLAAAGKDNAAVDAVLAQEGYAVTVADIKKYAEQNSDLSEEDLRKVAGGSQTDTDSAQATAIIGMGAACWL